MSKSLTTRLFSALLVFSVFVGCTEDKPITENNPVVMPAMGEVESDGPFQALPAPPKPPLPAGVR